MKRALSDLAAHETRVARPSFAEAFRFWLKLGFISFGGPTGPNRDYADGTGRKEEVGQPSAISARVELLHAVTGSGSAATGHLHRLASSQNLGRRNHINDSGTSYLSHHLPIVAQESR